MRAHGHDYVIAMQHAAPTGWNMTSSREKDKSGSAGQMFPPNRVVDALAKKLALRFIKNFQFSIVVGYEPVHNVREVALFDGGLHRITEMR